MAAPRKMRSVSTKHAPPPQAREPKLYIDPKTIFVTKTKKNSES